MSGGTPLLVTARMSEPIITYDDGMHLDGILAWAMYLDLTEDERKELPPITEHWAVDFPLPLDKWHVADADTPPSADPRLRDDDGVWGWMATQALADWTRRSVHELRKRVPLEELVLWTTTKTATVGKGPAKAYDLKFPTQWAPEVHWMAIGDADEVLRLLTTHVVGIGKHVAKGMGRVAKWSVQHADIDREFVTERRRIACRETEATMIGSIRPPYHHNSRHTWAREPTI
jgi:hypothetical protein